ncbi:hypothetical protein MLIT_25460 [Mycolicibacterium litorale]|uniref:Uncharacterized protein n=1 Tax=Mycolicibacterium litorale TaxID=758802 RepID=A0AAD1IKP0_9MYCO|nr:hypothetical protein MLIT_25460 [Mycolicibacterium litorale]
MVLARTTTPVLALGIMANVGAIALWALSRTAGAPFGPHAGSAELVQAADLCALLLQIYVVMGAAWVWHQGLQGVPVPGFASAVILFGAAGVVALASAVGVASGLRHGHHAPSGAEAGAGHHGTSAGHVDGHHGHAEPTAPPPAIEPARTPAISTRPPVPAQVLTLVPFPPPAAEPLHDHGDHDHGH